MSDGRVSGTIDDYQVTITRDNRFNTRYSISKTPANGRTTQKNIGIVKAGTYQVSVKAWTSSGRYFQGSGTINQ